MKKILITGGSGMVGRALIAKLDKEKYEIAVLSRGFGVEEHQTFKWNINEGFLDPEAVEFADVIIHLAGENIGGGRWTAKQKKRILDSRLKSTELLYEALQKQNKVIKIISASAVGYYGTVTNEKIYKESDLPGNDYVAEVVKTWERAVDLLKNTGSEVCKLRIGLVISDQGGAFKKLSLPFKYGLGSILGNGKQWMPWISVDDLTSMIEFLIEKEDLQSVYNAVAPQHIQHEQFARLLSNYFNKAILLPRIPAAFLSLILGEMASIIIKGSRVSSEKIIQEGYHFKHQKLEDLFIEFNN